MKETANRVPPAVLWIEEPCPGPLDAVPPGASPGREVVVVDPILNGDGGTRSPRIICDNLIRAGTNAGNCGLAPEKECIFQSKGAPHSLKPHLYTIFA